MNSLFRLSTFLDFEAVTVASVRPGFVRLEVRE